MYSLLLLVSSLAGALSAAVRSHPNRLNCTVDAIPTPDLFGASIQSIEVVPSNRTYQNSVVNFCNVSITYTHPGVGGGGFITGKIEYPWAGMGKAASERYAAVTTHGGHAVNYSAASWALLSPGNVNLYALENFASVSLNDMTVLGKQVTESYYAKKIKKSYWNGCSTGGRQGFMMAQRYSKAYNGILASASAMNWAEMVPGTFWLQRVMHEAGYFPSQYDLEATNKAAVAACDELDGLKDGVIERLGHYTFAKWL